MTATHNPKPIAVGKRKARTMTTETINLASVTTRPATRPVKTADGVCTGLHVTLAASVAMTSTGDAIAVQSGTVISTPTSGGCDGRLGYRNVSRCKIGTDGIEIIYLAK